MNTNPDDIQIMLWLEDELPNDEQNLLDAWAVAHPHLIEKRDALRVWRENVRNHIVAEMPPAYPDFFQAKLLKEITNKPLSDKNVTKPSASWRKKIYVPLAAAAALLLSFYIGKYSSGSSANAMVIYTPTEGVTAECNQESPAQGTVIVLNGVAPLKDDVPIQNASASSDKVDNTNQDKHVPVAP